MLACFVEMVEAFTIVLAVSVVRGAKTALVGTLAALFVLAVIIALGGSALAHLNLRPLKLIVGILLVIFGVRWLRKAILRTAGVIPLHDEVRIFQNEINAASGKSENRRYGVDLGGAATAFNGVLVEGIEVVFIVIALGSTARRLGLAIDAAATALAAVIALGLLLRAPLSKIPENAIKMIVAVMLTSIGTVWAGNGLGVVWPLGEWDIIGMAVVVALITALLVRVTKNSALANRAA